MILFITLFLSVIVHEYAHFFVAKQLGCKVLIYSIGFGKPILWSKKIKETTYQITPWIFGGYCQLKDETKQSKDKHAFTNLPYSSKLMISMAGIVINIFIGFVLLDFGYLFENGYLLYAGLISLTLGISNLLPIPALDGSYPYLVLLEKIYGKKRGYRIMNKLCKVFFILLMILNILSMPFIILSFIHGQIL